MCGFLIGSIYTDTTREIFPSEINIPLVVIFSTGTSVSKNKIFWRVTNNNRTHDSVFEKMTKNLYTSEVNGYLRLSNLCQKLALIS